MDRIDFYEQISRNRRNSWILIVVVFITLIFVSLGMGFIIANVYDPGIMFIFLIFSSIFNISYIVYTYYKSANIALSSVNAKIAEVEQYPQLHNIMDEISIASGMTKPAIYIMPSLEINAFATGRDPEHSVICVTEGCLKLLNREELQGVLAHEMTHIRNYDIRFVTLVASMVGLVSIIAQLFLRSMWYGGGRNRKGGGGLMIAGILLSIIAPILVKLVQLSISRKREYMADAGAVEITRYPQGLAAALKKIDGSYSKGMKTKVNSTVAPMFIADPIKNRLVNMFNTHPPIQERVKILENM